MHAKSSQLTAYHDNMYDITKILEFHAAINKDTPKNLINKNAIPSAFGI